MLLSCAMNIFRIFRQRKHPYNVKTANDDFFRRNRRKGWEEKKSGKQIKKLDKKCVEEVRFKERGLAGWSDGFSN